MWEWAWVLASPAPTRPADDTCPPAQDTRRLPPAAPRAAGGMGGAGNRGLLPSLILGSSSGACHCTGPERPLLDGRVMFITTISDSAGVALQSLCNSRLTVRLMAPVSMTCHRRSQPVKPMWK